jgi:hypothetical protein
MLLLLLVLLLLLIQVGIYLEKSDADLVARETLYGFTNGDKFDSQLKFQNINDLKLDEPATIIGNGRDYILVMLQRLNQLHLHSSTSFALECLPQHCFSI